MILAPTRPDPTAPRTRVLCVDDNPDIADTEAVLLGLFGFDARPCYSGREALAQAEAFEPRVCLLDIHMPGMGGDRVAAGLRVWAGRRPLCLIAVTAARHLSHLDRGAVFDVFLFKPVAPARLLAAVSGPAGRRIPSPGLPEGALLTLVSRPLQVPAAENLF